MVIYLSAGCRLLSRDPGGVVGLVKRPRLLTPRTSCIANMSKNDDFLNRKDRTRLTGLTVDETIEYQVLFALAALGKDEELRLLELHFKHRRAAVYEALDHTQAEETSAPEFLDHRESSTRYWKLTACVTTFAAILTTSLMIAVFYQYH
jgi:hypothetical protein